MNEVVYNEDLVETVKNKYLAVNIVAKRARDINADGLPVIPSNTGEKNKKPVAIATQELIEKKLHFEKSEAKVPAPVTPFTDVEIPETESDIFDEELLGEEHSAEVEEREEGI